ncbi:MAG: ATP-dependent DNA ligase [Pseudonocardiaceae bacterium]|nr:ATP-dependent DNA ligase [Pseudonocardiaceae bacterium]
MASDAATVDVEGRRLRLSNLDKVLYPSIGFTKGEVIDYYSRVAPVLLPHLADRPVSLHRWPDGVAGQGFWDKDASRHAPDWLRVVRLPSPGSSSGSDEVGYAILDGLPALVWAANLAGLELHIPQWTLGPRGGRRVPDLLVFDLDPGAPATVVECARVAEAVRDVLAADGFDCVVKSSGSKGLQVYARVSVPHAGRTSEYARHLAEHLADRWPAEVVATMAKARRSGKVLVDWSQNNPAKTTVAPYSLRGRAEPTVSTPVSWEEVARCREPEDLMFGVDDVLERISRSGDLFGVLYGERAGGRRRLPARPRLQNRKR